MARDLEAGWGSDPPLGDGYYGPAEWAGQGGGLDRTVTLAGVVASRAERRLAEDIVAEISGVRDVQNRLGLRGR